MEKAIDDMCALIHTLQLARLEGSGKRMAGSGMPKEERLLNSSLLSRRTS